MRFLPLVSLAAVAVLAACSSSTGSGSSAPKIVENHPGTLVLTKPARAAFVEQSDGAVEVVGTGGSAATTVNGVPVKIADDGTFHATLEPSVGLNVIAVVDGEARLESPFLYGHFVSPSQPIAHAIDVTIGSAGWSAPTPSASITTVLNRALRDRNLVGKLAGQSFRGETAGATWEYDVTGGHNDAVKVGLDTAPSGIAIRATGTSVVVEGTLSLTFLGHTYRRATRIIVDSATVSGTAALVVADGAIGASMPEASLSLDGFHWDSGDFGFPCCVDTIASKFLRPKIEDAITTGIQEQVPEAVKLTLGGVGLPKQMDLSAIGLKTPIALSATLDGGSFDLGASSLSASVLFGGTYPAGSPGAKAPGFLPLGGKAATLRKTDAFGTSFALDALNQLFFAAWGSGELSVTTPPSVGLTLTPALPPLLSVTPGGAVRLAVGEVVVQKVGAPSPLAAVSLIQDVLVKADKTALTLTADGEPTVSITYLSDGGAQSGNNLIADAAKSQLKALLSPFRIPLPSVALDGLGASFAGQTLGIDALAIDVDARSGRLGAEGAFALVQQ